MKNIWKTLTRQKAVFAILALLVIMGGAEVFTHTTFYTLYNWLDMLRSAKPDILKDIRERKKLDDDLETRLSEAIKEFKATFQARG